VQGPPQQVHTQAAPLNALQAAPPPPCKAFPQARKWRDPSSSTPHSNSNGNTQAALLQVGPRTACKAFPQPQPEPQPRK